MTKDELHALAEEAVNATGMRDFVQKFDAVSGNLAALDAEDAKRLRATSMRMMERTASDRELLAAMRKISDWTYATPAEPKKDVIGTLKDTVSGWFGGRR